MEKLLKAEELAEKLGIQVSTAYIWAHYGKIPHLKVNGCLRFRASDIEAWLSEPKPQPEPKAQPIRKSSGRPKKNGADARIERLLESVKAEVLA